MRTITTLTLAASVLILGASGALAQSMPGYVIQEYATLNGPVEMTFDPTGVMYVGRDLVPSGQGNWADPTYIHQVGIGGTPVVEYGAVAIEDPDAVLYDTTGSISGVPGSVLVAGGSATSPGGRLWAIHPDQSVHLLYGPDLAMGNPNALAFDNNGRLLIGDDDGQVYEYVGGTPNLLFAAPDLGGGIAIDPSNRIFNANIDGVIRLYDSDGTLLDGAFYTGLGTNRAAPIAIGPGGIWGNDLYTVHTQTGELLRIDMFGNATVIGTGFGDADRITADIAFGPDGAMYVSFLDEDRIIRVIPEPSALALLLLGGLVAARRRT